MSDRTDEILANVLAMDETELARFLSTLSADTLDHLDILLAKREKHSSGMQQYLDSR